MQLTPLTLVVGGFIPPGPPGEDQVTGDKINRIWSELAPTHGLTQLQMFPDQKGANFVGRVADEGVTIQPPLIQTRSGIDTTAEQAADAARSILGVIARHLQVSQIFNLGVRHVYTAPLPDNDARTFVLGRLLSRTDEDLAELTAGSAAPWGGVKYVIPMPDRYYTLILEPYQADEMRSLYIDLDALFQGPAELDSIISRAREAKDYLTGPVDRYLDAMSELA